MRKHKIYGSNLRTVVFTDEELPELLTASQYAARYYYTVGQVYYAIKHGYVVAKKYKSKWLLWPQEIEDTHVFR